MNVTERIGVSKVQLIVNEEFHWIFREQPIEDYGIDAHIEIQNEKYAQGKMIAVQIKSGVSYFQNTNENKIVYYPKQKHLEYWSNSILPVIIILYNPETKQCVWHYIDNLVGHHKILIDKNNIFNKSAKKELQKIANIKPYEIAKRHRRNYIETNLSLEVFKEQISDDKKAQNSLEIEQILSIDFGTSQTRFASNNATGKIEYVKSDQGENYFNSLIGFDNDYQYYIGDEVRDREDCSSFITIRNFKRELGLNTKYKVFGLELSAEDITTLYLWKILNKAEKQFNLQFKKCWISEPVDFSYVQRKAYENCIVNCGLDIIRVISESSCVSINPKLLDEKEVKEYIVIDLGGGTLDSSIVTMERGVIEVVGTSGDRTIGGVDYDNLLKDYLINKIGKYYPDIDIDNHLRMRLINIAEEIKIGLSENEQMTIMVPGCHDIDGEEVVYCEIKVDRSEFRKVVKKLDEKLENCLIKIKEKYIELVDNELVGNSYNILLGGMGSRIFTVTEKIKKVFPGCTLIDKYSGKAIIEGLAFYSGKLNGYEYASGILLLDVLYCSIIIYGNFIIKDTDSSEEEITEISLLLEETTIPTRKSVLVLIEGEQDVSIVVICGDQKNAVKEIKLGNEQERTEYEITADVDANNQIEIKILDQTNNSKHEFMIERMLGCRDHIV